MTSSDIMGNFFLTFHFISNDDIIKLIFIVFVAFSIQTRAKNCFKFHSFVNQKVKEAKTKKKSKANNIFLNFSHTHAPLPTYAAIFLCAVVSREFSFSFYTSHQLDDVIFCFESQTIPAKYLDVSLSWVVGKNKSV